VRSILKVGIDCAPTDEQKNVKEKKLLIRRIYKHFIFINKID